METKVNSLTTQENSRTVQFRRTFRFYTKYDADSYISMIGNYMKSAGILVIMTRRAHSLEVNAFLEFGREASLLVTADMITQELERVYRSFSLESEVA